MDPDATLAAICDSLMETGDEGTAEMCQNLLDWMDKGGFHPRVEYHQLTTILWFIKLVCETGRTPSSGCMER